MDDAAWFHAASSFDEEVDFMAQAKTSDLYRAMARELVERADTFPPGQDKEVLLQIARDYELMSYAKERRSIYVRSR